MNVFFIRVIFLIIAAIYVSGCGGSTADNDQTPNESEQKIIDAINSKKDIYSQYHRETSPSDLTGTWITYEVTVSDGVIAEKSYTTKIKHNMVTGRVDIFSWIYDVAGFYEEASWYNTWVANLTENAYFDFNGGSDQFDDISCCDGLSGPKFMSFMYDTPNLHEAFYTKKLSEVNVMNNVFDIGTFYYSSYYSFWSDKEPVAVLMYKVSDEFEPPHVETYTSEGEETLYEAFEWRRGLDNNYVVFHGDSNLERFSTRCSNVIEVGQYLHCNIMYSNGAQELIQFKIY